VDVVSGKYMVDLERVRFLESKAYGQVHKGHRYGTLDTLDEWYWENMRLSEERQAKRFDYPANEGETWPLGELFADLSSYEKRKNKK